MKFTILGIILSLTAIVNGQNNTTNKWIQNSFPSEKHKNGDYIAFRGEMRGQRLNYFGVSPSNPDFMIMAGNMAGQGFVSNDGKDFKPFGTEAGWCGNTFGFSPHNGTLAFALIGTKVYKGTDDSTWGTEHPFGIYRTQDTGETWTQVLRLPENIPGETNSIDTTPGQEPRGKCALLVDPSPNRSTHVYYASGEKGLVRSTSNGNTGTWEVVAFENKFIKTLSAGVSLSGETHLYAIVADGYGKVQNKDGQVYYDSGRLYRIDITNEGEMSEPKLCLNGLYNITDVETNHLGGVGFVIVDASAAGGESTGGRALYPFGLKGDVISGIGSIALGNNIDGATLNKNKDGIILDADDHSNLSSLGAIYLNPYNTNHWVIQLGGDLQSSFTWSTDGGSTWNDIERNIDTNPVTGQESVPDFISGAIGQHHMKDYGWAMDRESGRGDQGSAIGFMDPSTVVWMSSSKDRPILKSMDYGATAATFTTGSETKWLNQINTSANGQLIACTFGEYGFTLSTDGGLSWKGFTEFSSNLMNDIENRCTKDYGKGGASNRAAFAAVFEEGIPLNEPQHAIVLGSRSGIVIDAWQTDDLATWELSTRGDANDPLRVFENHKDDTDLVGEAYWVDNYVYLGNLRSKDNGLTFDRIYAEPGGAKLVVLAVSSGNGKVAIATSSRKEVSQWGWAIYLTSDGGDTWRKLENPKRETATSPTGTSTKLYPISFKMYCKNRHAIAIDPRTEKDPSIGGNVRVLLAGRQGIYEYDDSRITKEKWIINADGLDESLHFNTIASVPWMGSVQFDPSMSGKVFALQTSDRLSMSDWKNPEINENCIYEGEGTIKPVYMSTDWGKNWSNIDNEELPDVLTVSTLHVSKSGELYVGSVNSGYYQTDPKDIHLNIKNVKKSTTKIYPNPAQHTINIELENSVQTDTPIIIYTSVGKEFKRITLKNTKEGIDVSNWPKGMYFINISGKYTSQAIIIN